ncbi:polysaccharide deacetylase family protein [Thermodesulfitimonas sp.]
MVLCYHRVLPSWALHWGRLFWRSNEFSRYAISRREFAQQLDYLRQAGVRFVTPREAEEFLSGRRHLPGKLALVTFDDGDLSVYKKAFPVLKERQIPFLLFLIASQVGKEWEGFTMCSWEQVREMVASGLCSVGLHTYDLHYWHYWDPQAKKPVFLLPGREKLFAEDTARGIACLEEHLGMKVRYLAYPYGFGTPTTDGILRTQGFSLVFTLRAKVNRPGDAPFVGRVLVTPESWPQVAAWARSGSAGSSS